MPRLAARSSAVRSPAHAQRSQPRHKAPFDIGKALKRIRVAVAPYPKAALFELAERGHASPFEQLVACMISIRTRDEVSLPVALRLFEIARTPEEMSKLSPERIDALIRDCNFHLAKAWQIHKIAKQVVSEHGGELPCELDTLLSLKGVGPKTANLVLGIACGEPRIGVDIHVHRVTNRWGYIQASTPEKTMAELQKKLPRDHWVEINALLVPFGKHVCTGLRPRCSTCPVLEMCRQIGVTHPR